MATTDSVVFDLFAGAGGLSRGFEQAGFRIGVANEFHKDAVKTYIRSHPKAVMIHSDVRDITRDSIAEKLDVSSAGISIDDVNVVIGGPPCQGFSTAGLKNHDDPRNNLIAEFFRIVREVQPDAFVMENVPGLVKMNNQFPMVEKFLEKTGYSFSWRLLRAFEYGVPQLRQRFFAIGYKDTRITTQFPSPTHHIPSRPTLDGRIACPTVGEVLSDLPHIEAGETATEYDQEPTNKIQKYFRSDTNGTLYNHQATRHSAERIALFKSMPLGGTWDDANPALRGKKRMFQKWHPKRIAWTVTSAPEDSVHYSANRIPTVRETARLQTFPDNHEFLGQRTAGNSNRRNYCSQTQQVGNAVPVLLARAVGTAVANLLN